MQIGNKINLTEKQIIKIKALITEAGGARYVASQCGVHYDTYHNVLRGHSRNHDALQKMIDKAKEIISNKKTVKIKI